MVDAQERSPMIPCPQCAIWKCCPAWKQIRKEERDKVLDKLCKICPFLDERPETCENCVVETVRKELRRAGEPDA